MGRSRNKYRNKQAVIVPAAPSNVVYEGDKNSNDEVTKDANDTNVLVLSAEKQPHNSNKKMEPKPRKKLTKKQRKNLQQIIERKKKKLKRATILEELSKVQVSTTELAQLASVAHLGSRTNTITNLSKRPLPSDLREEVEKLNATRLSKKQRRMNRQMECEKLEVTEEVSCSSSEQSEDDEVKDAEVERNLNESGICTDEDDDGSILKRETGNTTHVENTILHESASSDCDTAKKSKTNKDDYVKIPEIKTAYVPVNRSDDVQENRLKLPILAVEQEIIEAIHHNPVVVLCGETGSGKTTQVPQFLYEAGYAVNGMVGITEPRRVAAISMSQRVGMEMNLSSDIVSYQIRYEGNVSTETKIKFMTDGVLLREVQRDFTLSRYSVIVIDEAHERSVYTDVLIGLLSRIVPLRHKKGNPLKLIIMSATLRIKDFVDNENLFKIKPPLIKVEARQFPVTIHFNRKTPPDTENGRAYITEAYNKICKIHRTLPSGGILVFVTGQQEVHSLCRMLRSTFPYMEDETPKPKIKKTESTKNKSTENVLSDNEENQTDQKDSVVTKVNLDSYSVVPDDNANDLIDGDATMEDSDTKPSLSDEENQEGSDDEFFNGVQPSIDQSIPMKVLPLYSLLAPSKQRKIFEHDEESNARLCIISTNVAETSLTIPGVKYVVDTGKVKKRYYDKMTGVSSFRVTWISRASADQRAGRAGRTSPGHAYRLYSSAVFMDFPEFSAPEIDSRPVPDLVLLMKNLNIDRVVNFPFPTPPSHDSLVSAEKLLFSLAAITSSGKSGQLKSNLIDDISGKITDLGRAMAAFPVHPRFAKMLAQVTADDYSSLLPYVVTIVAALTVRDVFDQPEQANDPEQKDEAKQQLVRLRHFKSLWGGGSNPHLRALGDIMVLLGAVGSADFSGLTQGFCTRNCLRYKAMVEIRRLRAQIINMVNLLKPDVDLFLNEKLQPPTDQQVALIRQVILASFGDHVAMKIPDSEVKSSGDSANIKKLIGGYRSLLMEDPIFIHPDSVLAQNSKLPEFVVFQEIIESMSGRSYMKGVIVIEQDWLSIVCPQHCFFSAPLSDPPPFLCPSNGHVKCHVNATYGTLSWPLGEVEIDHPRNLNRFRWFANFLLAGEVFSKVKRWNKCLLSRPETMIKSWAKLQPRTDTLLRALVDRNVDDKSELTKLWMEDKQYLLPAFKDWIPFSAHNDLLSNWPPVE